MTIRLRRPHSSTGRVRSRRSAPASASRLRAAAARFPLRHPAVTSVLIGARSAAEITDAIAMRGHDIPAELWDELDAAVPQL